jgi:hypothetical protein
MYLTIFILTSYRYIRIVQLRTESDNNGNIFVRVTLQFAIHIYKLFIISKYKKRSRGHLFSTS